nr:class I tRNA ligase family protein [Candidatus Peribacteraceae bacterium]
MLEKAYDPKAVEDRIYEMWEKSGAFKPEACDPKGEPFTVSMPPPNATGQLHLGHAVMLALEDIFIRFARMQGKKTLWVPGTDHAAIATENVVIKQLKDGGMKDPRKELGREKLIAKIAEFVEGSKNTIRGQVRKMGSSCDWSRERYTFEPALNRCVNEVFKKMYSDGLIYRGHRIVNWDPKLQTTVSDDEVDYKEEKGAF